MCPIFRLFAGVCPISGVHVSCPVELIRLWKRFSTSIVHFNQMSYVSYSTLYYSPLVKPQRHFSTPPRALFRFCDHWMAMGMLGWPLGYPRILRARATLRHCWGTVRNKMSLVSVRLKIYVSHVYYRIYIYIMLTQSQSLSRWQSRIVAPGSAA